MGQRRLSRHVRIRSADAAIADIPADGRACAFVPGADKLPRVGLANSVAFFAHQRVIGVLASFVEHQAPLSLIEIGAPARL